MIFSIFLYFYLFTVCLVCCVSNFRFVYLNSWPSFGSVGTTVAVCFSNQQRLSTIDVWQANCQDFQENIFRYVAKQVNANFMAMALSGQLFWPVANLWINSALAENMLFFFGRKLTDDFKLQFIYMQKLSFHDRKGIRQQLDLDLRFSCGQRKPSQF